jgi:hypothetical protein
MQFNSIVFAAPKCSYSTESLFKQIIYVPKHKTPHESIPCLFLDREDPVIKIPKFCQNFAQESQNGPKSLKPVLIDSNKNPEHIERLETFPDEPSTRDTIIENSANNFILKSLR